MTEYMKDRMENNSKFLGSVRRKTLFENCLHFILGFAPFGPWYGDRNVANGDDVSECFSVSSNFPLFTTKDHHRICVSIDFFRIKLYKIEYFHIILIIMYKRRNY